MSLFSPDEVCEDCKHANFHECCHTFCSCEIDKEIDCVRGTCEDKEEKFN